jgi:ferric-dicitrate binding protein FerR (iron transport regulator)
LLKNLKKMSIDREINVDKAWNKVHARMKEAGTEANSARIRFLRSTFIRIAAVALVLLSLGSVAVYLNRTGVLSKKIIVTTGNDQQNLKVSLPDGSNIYLNRNTKLSYRSNFGNPERNVSLDGEAFFEITGDPRKPFTIDAGKARIEVLGTSFNVITNNDDSAVEVFVATGKVMLTNNSGAQNMVVDPGYIGIISSKQSERKINKDPNYLSWNTGKLAYDGQKLENVFSDLKKIYGIDIIPSDPEILNNTLTATYENEPHEKIMRLICSTFNLDYTKDGNVYHLAKK